jgi:hypothetical protein
MLNTKIPAVVLIAIQENTNMVVIGPQIRSVFIVPTSSATTPEMTRQNIDPAFIKDNV